MSIYSEISKKLGWQNFTVKDLPSRSVAEILLKGVQEGKIEDFETVFRFHRFSETPTTFEAIEVYKIIDEAYRIGREKFS